MEKLIVIGVFAMILAALLVAYERPVKRQEEDDGARWGLRVLN